MFVSNSKIKSERCLFPGTVYRITLDTWKYLIQPPQKLSVKNISWNWAILASEQSPLDADTRNLDVGAKGNACLCLEDYLEL